MLVPRPVIRVRQPKTAPELASGKHFLEFFNKILFASKEFDESLCIVRNCKAIVPCISFSIVLRKDIDPFLLADQDKSTILISWIKELGIFVPYILVELGSVPKIAYLISFVQEFGNFADCEIIEAQL